jgi:hypothetical protein
VNHCLFPGPLAPRLPCRPQGRLKDGPAPSRAMAALPARAHSTRGVLVRCQPGQEHPHFQHLREERAGPFPLHRRGALRVPQERAPLPHHVTDAAACGGVAAAEPWADAWGGVLPRALRGRRRAVHALTTALLAASVLPAVVLAVQPLLPACAAAAVAGPPPPPGAWQVRGAAGALAFK